MTAEVALLNKRAVALAADSAVTYGGRGNEKIFESANKIFALSKYHPIGLMIYGPAEIMEVPWEIVIKQYRSQLGTSSFSEVQDYAEHFLAFLEDHRVLNDETAQEKLVNKILHFNYLKLRKKALSHAEQVLQETDTVSHSDLKEIVKAVIESHYRNWQDVNKLASTPDNYAELVADEYASVIQKHKEDKFEGLLTSASSRWLRELGEFLLTKVDPHRDKLGVPGVVFAGYGDDDIFPVVRAFRVRGVIGDHIQRREEPGRSAKVGPGDTRGAAIPFAQEDVVQTFLEGIDPDFKRAILSGLIQVTEQLPDRIIDGLEELTESEKEERKRELRGIGGKLVRRFLRGMERYRRSQHTDPIVETISVLPKDELAEAASSLVQLTSFKRRVSVDQSETVKGPIDVAVISKGDGLIWIDRKHYFDADLNHHFFQNYFRESDASHPQIGANGDD